MQNRLERVVLLQALNADSLASVCFGGRFDPERIEILEILPGTAWDGTDHTSQVFQRTIDPAGGTYEVITSVLGSSAGLSGAGPHTLARMRLRAAGNALTPSSRWAHQRLTVEPGRSGISHVRGPLRGEWVTQDLLLRFGYLGDLATGWMGADSMPPHMIPRPDGRIHFEDQIIFTVGWNGVDGVRDPIADIGPVTGTAPDLISSPDRRWDIEDIIAFTTMYSWDVESGREPWLPVLSGEGPKSPPPRSGPRISCSVVRSRCRMDGEMIIEVVEGRDLTGVHLVIGWNPGAVSLGNPAGRGRPVSTELLAGSEGEMFLLCPGTGCLEIGITRLDPVMPGSDVSGELVRIPFRSAGGGNNGWTLFWDLYDSRGRPVSWGRWSDAGVHSTVQLYSPRPNPSSREAALRFRLERGLSGRLAVFEVGGRLLRSFRVDGEGGSGQQLWFDGLDDQGRPLAPGVYYLYLESAGETTSSGFVIAR